MIGQSCRRRQGGGWPTVRRKPEACAFVEDLRHNLASMTEVSTLGKRTRVVVSGGGRNLYEISESDGWFHAYKVNVALINSRDSIGRARTFDHALNLIKSHSGKSISKVG